MLSRNNEHNVLLKKNTHACADVRHWRGANPPSIFGDVSAAR